MPAVSRIAPKTVFTPDEWRHLTSRSSLRGMWLVSRLGPDRSQHRAGHAVAP